MTKQRSLTVKERMDAGFALTAILLVVTWGVLLVW